MNISFLAKHMSSEKLRNKLKSNVESIVNYLQEGNDHSALRAARNINALAKTDFQKADFRSHMKLVYEEFSQQIRRSIKLAEFFIRNLPLYNSEFLETFVSDDENLNALLVDRIMEDRFLFVRDDIDEDPARQVMLVYLKLMELEHHDCALKLLEFYMQSPQVRGADCRVTDIIFHPLIDARHNAKICNFVKDHGNDLVLFAGTAIDIAERRHEEQLMENRESPHKYSSSYYKCASFNHLSIEQILASSEFGSKALVRALLSSNKSGLSPSSSHDCLVRISNIIGNLGKEMDLINYTSFYGKLGNPINERAIVYYAHYFINTNDDYLPHFPFIKSGIFNGLRSVLDKADPGKELRVHNLIERLKSLPLDEKMKGELAKKIPARYLSKHPDLGRANLERDLGM
jgi:hypothetical protein